MICIENIGVSSALQKMYLRLQFHRYNKIYGFISFTKTRSRAQKFWFLKFLKNKTEKYLHMFFQILCFSAIVCLFRVFII